MNPFEESLEDTFRTRKVRVVARDETEYIGFVERIDWHNRHFILSSAETGDGDSVGAVLVSHAERVELYDQEKTIQRIALDDISPSPYFAAEFDRRDNQQYIEEVRSDGILRSFPQVRPVEDGYELVDGHKGIWVCNQAGFETQPCEIVVLSEWEAAQQFVFDHIPSHLHVDPDGVPGQNWYSNEEIEASVRSLYDRWGDQILDLHVVEYNVDRLSIDLEG